MRIRKITKLNKWLTSLILIAVLAATFVSIHLVQSNASGPCIHWLHCPITQRYGQNEEHGVDLLTHGLPITARLSGVITFDRWECWSGECVQDITWRLDYPQHARGSRYMYVQIASSRVHVGEHVADGALLGYSGSFIEFGLTPDWAYGVSGWHWGVNPQFLL